jgi:peptidoglycan/xylan/chitin deacetylase (PgdA/CDA1 family)
MSASPEIAQKSARRFAKRILRLAISIVYSVIRSLWRRYSKSKNMPGVAVVLYYHSVPENYKAQFESQVKMIRRRSILIALKDLSSLPSGSHCVAVTFDDALQTFVENAVPVLMGLGVPATVFAVANMLGKEPDWGGPYYSPNERVASADRLRDLPDLISVGSHSLTHPHLHRLDPDAAFKEINHSRERLQRELGKPVKWFCFPYGAFSDSVIRLCRDAGYERVFTTEPALFCGDDKEFVVGRVEVDPWDWPLEFRLKISGAYCWQPWARTIKRKFLGRRRQLSEASNLPVERQVVDLTGS